MAQEQQPQQTSLVVYETADPPIQQTTVQADSSTPASPLLTSSSSSSAATHQHASNWMPRNRVSSALLHNFLMRYRPFPSFVPILWRATIFNICCFLGVVAFVGGLGYKEHLKAQTWVTRMPHPYLSETSAVSALLFEYLAPAVFLPLIQSPNGLVPYLLGSSWELLLVFHKQIAVLDILLAVVHSVAELVLFGYNSKWTWDKYIRFLKPYHMWTGVVCFAAMVLLGLTAIPLIRKHVLRRHEFFYCLHILLAILYVVTLTLHVKDRVFLWYFLGPPLVLWAVDLLWRIYAARWRGSVRVVAKTDLIRSAATCLELEFNHTKHFCFEPGQYGMLTLYALNCQSHPLSMIASPSVAQPNPRRIKILIKALGDWSGKLQSMPLATLRDHWAYLTGPMGRVPVEVDRYDTLVIVGGGCAIAPAIGFAQHMYFNHHQHGKQLPKHFHLVLTCQFRDMFLPFQADLKAFVDDGTFSVVCYESGPNSAPWTEESRPPMSAEEASMIPAGVQTRVGMPNFATVFQDIKKASPGQSIACLVSGPPGLQDAVLKQTKIHKWTCSCEAYGW